MNLQGRNLSAELRGDDVRLLQSELGRLAYSLPPGELAAAVFGPATLNAVKDFQKQHNLPPSGVVDAATAAAINAAVDALSKLVVRGRVRRATGGALPGVAVAAMDKELRHEYPLGHATTSADGTYTITYTRAQIHSDRKDSADLIVRALDASGKPLATSAVAFNAPAEAVVDLVVGGATYLGPSEYERVAAQVVPELDGVQPEELTDDDLRFLSSETGLLRDWIAIYRLAAQFARSTELPAAAFYGLVREGT